MTPFRWNGTSTNILRYDVPRTTQSGEPTERWSIKIDPEVEFEEFQVFLCRAGDFNKINQREELFLIDNAIIV